MLGDVWGVRINIFMNESDITPLLEFNGTVNLNEVQALVVIIIHE